MQIACPNCQATYELERAVFGNLSGSQFKCFECGRTFVVDDTADLPADADKAGAEPIPLQVAPQRKPVPSSHPAAEEETPVGTSTNATQAEPILLAPWKAQADTDARPQLPS